MTVLARLVTPARVLLAVYLLVPLVLTLSPVAPGRGLEDFHAALQPLVAALTGDRAQIDLGEAEALGNVLLFLPIGLLVPLAVPGIAPLLVLVGAGLASLAVEALQSRVLEARQPALQDVLHNMGGAAIGLVLVGEVLRRTRR